MAKQSKHVRKPAKKAKHKKVASQGAHGTGTITDRDLKRAERSLSKSRGLQTSKYNTLHLSLPVKIILIIFVVIISISMMVPSLASVVAGNRNRKSRSSSGNGRARTPMPPMPPRVRSTSATRRSSASSSRKWVRTPQTLLHFSTWVIPICGGVMR